jgi:hypothetical protein
MLIVALAVFVVSLTDVAVTTTEPAAPGAVYVVAVPLAVAVGLNEPQEDAGVQLQVTPFAAESLLTVAVIASVALGLRLDCAPVRATLIGVVPPPPPPVELLLPELQATSAAIMQTAKVVEIVFT